MNTRASRRRAVLVALLPAVVLALGVLAFALVSRRSPTRLTLELAWAGPSRARPFGSGAAGVDLLPLACDATLRVLALAGAVSLFGFVTGTPLGAAAGLARGRFERFTLALCDLVQSFPTFLLALAVLAAVEVPTRLDIGLVFCVTAWAPFARLSLAQAHTLSDAEFVHAARALGVRQSRVVLRHVLPNLLGPVAIQLGTEAAGVVLGEAALGFIGLGPGDGVSLGALLEQGTLGMLRAPHVLVVGAIAVVLTSGSLQLASEGVRRALSSRA